MGALFTIVVVGVALYGIVKLTIKSGGIAALPAIGDVVHVKYGHFNPRVATDTDPDMIVKVTKIDGGFLEGDVLSKGTLKTKAFFTMSDVTSGVSSVRF